MSEQTKTENNSVPSNQVEKVEIPPNDISFSVAGEVLIKLCENGIILIRGEQVDDNQEVYQEFRTWLLETASVDNHRFQALQTDYVLMCKAVKKAHAEHSGTECTFCMGPWVPEAQDFNHGSGCPVLKADQVLG